jgi:hypothetical protein
MQVPIIIDFEASGFGKDSYPIEVGFVGETGNGWCSLIKPENDWRHWDRDAAQMHHISREILLLHGKSCIEVAGQLNRLLEGCTVYTDGWVHDYIWMARLFDAADLNPHFQLEDLRRVLTAEQESRWHSTKSAVLEELHATRHRASTDALVLQMTWLRSCGAG